MKRKIRIAIADDQLLFRQGLMAIIQSQDDIKILFDAEDGHDLLMKLRASKTKPDIIVTDLKMPNLNGVEATKLIRDEFNGIKIIALTSYFSKPFILNMISIGAVAYLAKNSTPKLMLHTIREVHSKGFYYDEIVFNYIKEGQSNSKANKVKSSLDDDYFTERELEILELICKQFTAKEIADKLSLSKRTVETHRSHLLLKTQSKNIAGLVVYALTNKIINHKNDSL